MYFGVDYYPEHWPKERWAEDAKLMKQANLNVVRMAEFAWSKLEPKEGVYDFSWLDEAIEILAREGIKTVLGTPTATPPKWLMDKHPGIYAKDRYGRIRGFGSRRHYCYNDPVYQEYTRRIVAKMGEHFGNNPNVVAWQIDNEFGCHNTTRCYCEDCLAAFKKWLQAKYGSLDALNQAWGTVFWSQIYTSWDEIILPGYTACEDSDPNSHGHNPGLLLDFYRFSSDSVVKYQKLQIDELRKYTSKPITHNFMGHFSDIDYFNLSKDLDFVSWDNYPNMQWGQSSPEWIAMAHDLMRGLKGKNFWVMEQQSGPCGWSVLGDTPKPGQLRLWTYQALAHGAEGILYFRWRACTFGAEQYWYGILDHDGVPRRRYREIQQTGKEVHALAPWIEGSKVLADVALIKSYDNAWSHGFQPHNPQFDYNRLLLQYYRGLVNNNLTVDVISVEQDLSKYKLVLMPAFNLMREDLREKLEAYVAQGGNLLITLRSGTRDWNNKMDLRTVPGAFREMAGVELKEFDSLNRGRTVRVQGAGVRGAKLGDGTASVWCDVLEPISAEVLAQYAEEYYQGEAAVTVNSFGRGKVYYVGCIVDDAFLNRLVELLIEEAELEPAPLPPLSGVEVVKKEKDGRQYLMVLNHNPAPVTVTLNQRYTELISGQHVDDALHLSAYGVAMLAV